MKILFVHPDDSTDLGPWCGVQWDGVFDLGWSGRHRYKELADALACPVSSVHDAMGHEDHRVRLRAVLALGSGRLVDSESVDWWETFSAIHYQALEQLLLISAIAGQLPDGAELFATRPHLALQVLIRMGREIEFFLPSTGQGLTAKIRRISKAVLALRPAQVLDVIFDKWDPEYQVRRQVGRREPPLAGDIVLLPSAYVNVSRAQAAYARLLPENRFLLVATRASGRRLALPDNVAFRSLAAYALRPSNSTDNEYRKLLTSWERLRTELSAQDRVLNLAFGLSLLDGFPRFLRSGLSVRDAWREVFAREPIVSVLSGDEHNPFTRLPVLLARARGIRTVFCDHGALNMSFGIRPSCSDTYLASSEMARDYLVRWCGLPPARVASSGPGNRHSLKRTPESRKDRIVFFSECYELSTARTATLYAELLPELCAVARRTNRKVIVKLHPFESARLRRQTIEKLLNSADANLIELRTGPMTPDLFERAWFSVTVESSVAVESTVNGVPCFLCQWFDVSWYGYARQYAKFSAGYLLDSPEKIREIPELLERMELTDDIRERLWNTADPDKLTSLLYGRAPAA